MRATTLLILQHDDVADLFEAFEDTDDETNRPKIFEKIGATLAAHDAIEREIFYPACKAVLGEDEELLGESLAEHGLVEFCIYKASIADENDLPHHVKVLKETVEHHVKEEQDELFPKIERAMTEAQLETLGAKMEKRFDLAVQGDFRTAVRKNLEQVMEGALETAPEAKPIPVAKKTKATNGTSRTLSHD